MNFLLRISRPVFLALVGLFLLAEAHAQTSIRLSSRFIARGEQALLEVTTIGREPDIQPALPPLKGIDIQAVQFGSRARMLPGRILAYSTHYILSSYEVGQHRIPSIEVTAGGVRTRTEPVDFEIFDPDELQWREVRSGGRTLRYASSFRAMKSQVYEGETLPVEIKIYVPRDLMVEDWGVPEFERDGVASWRFEPSQSRGQINLLGRPYFSLAYPSTMSPTRTGTVGIGPATVRLTTHQIDLRGGRSYEQLFLQIPKLELESKPLPSGAPEGFENAVGQFAMNVNSTETEIRQGDPVSVEVIVSGSGNLDTMRPPKLIDETGWKIYEASPSQRGDERRDLSGNILFRQFMRPLEIKSMIPPFRLVYFDPLEEAYKTLTSEPIQLTVLPGSGAATVMEFSPIPQAMPVPLERMTDILSIMRPAQLTVPAGSSIPPWSGHALAGLLAFGLLARAMWLRFSHLFHKDPVKEARLKDLRHLESARKGNDTDFLKSAGSFIERWLGENPPPEIKTILAERDAVCFRKEPPAQILDKGRREKILRLLRQTSTCLTILTALAFSTPSASAKDTAVRALEAYESAKYEEAAKLWLEAGPYETLSAETLYNIGNASYRMGSPGHASLFYRRALVRDPGMQEARQNLRFIERKLGAITIHRPDFQYILARIPLPAWKGGVWTGAWCIVLSLLIFPATRAGSRWRIAAICGLIAGPLIAAGGVLGWHYFPDDSEFAPLERQAVVLMENSVLHSDAARTAPEIIDAPQGALCEIIRERGRWAYVAFATQTRGWIPLEAIEKVIPDGKPVPPEARKAKATSNSA